jgi:hypothetical protein
MNTAIFASRRYLLDGKNSSAFSGEERWRVRLSQNVKFRVTLSEVDARDAQHNPDKPAPIKAHGKFLGFHSVWVLLNKELRVWRKVGVEKTRRARVAFEWKWGKKSQHNLRARPPRMY